MSLRKCADFSNVSKNNKDTFLSNCIYLPYTAYLQAATFHFL
jgi:hypothetical protein